MKFLSNFNLSSNLVNILVLYSTLLQMQYKYYEFMNLWKLMLNYRIEEIKINFMGLRGYKFFLLFTITLQRVVYLKQIKIFKCIQYRVVIQMSEQVKS